MSANALSMPADSAVLIPRSCMSATMWMMTDEVTMMRRAIGSGFESKTITLSCGKLTTGVTVPQWSSILMLRNLKSPETYFQAAFRVQSPWSIKNPNGDNPNEEEILKPVCFVFDFAPTRALPATATPAAPKAPRRALSPSPTSASMI